MLLEIESFKYYRLILVRVSCGKVTKKCLLSSLSDQVVRRSLFQVSDLILRRSYEKAGHYSVGFLEVDR